MDPIDDHDSGQRYRDSDVLIRVILLSLAFTQVAMTSFLHWPPPPQPLSPEFGASSTCVKFGGEGSQSNES
jgi:hypothetical protein